MLELLNQMDGFDSMGDVKVTVWTQREEGQSFAEGTIR